MKIENKLFKKIMAYAVVFIIVWVSAMIVWYLLGLILTRPSHFDFSYNLKVCFTLAIFGVCGPIAVKYLKHLSSNKYNRSTRKN